MSSSDALQVTGDASGDLGQTGSRRRNALSVGGPGSINIGGTSGGGFDSGELIEVNTDPTGGSGDGSITATEREDAAGAARVAEFNDVFGVALNQFLGAEVFTRDQNALRSNVAGQLEERGLNQQTQSRFRTSGNTGGPETVDSLRRARENPFRQAAVDVFNEFDDVTGRPTLLGFESSNIDDFLNRQGDAAEIRNRNRRGRGTRPTLLGGSQSGS